MGQNTETTMTTNGDNRERFTCWLCGDIDYLCDSDGLCRQCRPESDSVAVEEFAVIAMRALTGERVERRVKWRIR